MREYETYKDSGVEWIGKIPGHWKVGRLRFLTELNDGGVWGQDPDGDEGTPIIRSTEITLGGGWDLSNLTIRKLSDEERDSRSLRCGDIVITKSSGSQDHIGKSGLVDGLIESRGYCFSNFVQRLRLHSSNPRFFHYLLNSLVVRHQYRFYSETSTGLSNLSQRIIGQIAVPVLPLPEQEQIVSFLDERTSLVDEIIENKTQRIELLKEMRSSLISEVVTKGLNPEVPMKDLGVEWIGEIPSHWTTGKPKFLFTPVSREPEESDDVVTCFRDGTVTLRKNRREDGFTMSLQEIGYQRILSGDLVVHEMDGFEGSIGVSDSTGKSTPVYTVIPPSGDYSVRYWMYLLRVMSKSGFIESLSKGIRQRTTDFRWKMWRDQYFPLPPLVEQQQIVSFLDERTLLIDQEIGREENSIRHLQEFRQSLIHEVVTGKMDVRGVVTS